MLRAVADPDGARGAEGRTSTRRTSRHPAVFRALRGRMEGHHRRDQRSATAQRRRTAALPLQMDDHGARIFRLVYRNDLTQQSWFSVIGDHVRPEKYRAEQGASSVSLDFDWNGGRPAACRKTSRWISAQERTQDVMSIQIEVMLDLKNGICRRLFKSSTRTSQGFHLYPRGPGENPDRHRAARYRHRLESARRQRPHSAHVVRALAGLRTGAGRAVARRQPRICDADQSMKR